MLQASVLIPTLNEAGAIEACIERVAAQDIGPAALEVILVDGCSGDGTVDVATGAASRHGFGRFAVVPNPAQRTAAGLHTALGHVSTPYVVRVDARSRIPPNYVSTVTATLSARPEVGVVGGAQVPIMSEGSPVASGIARALSNRLTTGLSRYRRSSRSGPADTVWMGAFRTEELHGLGGWDPQYGVNEDFELNQRYVAAGRVVWFDAALRSGYVPRRDLLALSQQYRSYGRAKGRAWARGTRPQPRQLVLLIGPVLATGLVCWSVRRFGAVASLVGLVVTALAVDHLGAERSPASALVRASSMLATGVYTTSWWLGVIEGWLQRSGGPVAPAGTGH